MRGQLLLSLIIGTSAGIGLWLLGTLGLGAGRGQVRRRCSAPGSRFTELIPYLGPWLGAIPPILYALVVDPISALWVVLLFLGIHQIEGHIVVPNVMGSALRLHPLLVIFGLLAGGELYGLPGVLVALPLLAVDARDLGVLLRAGRARGWTGGPVPVEVEVEDDASGPAGAAGRSRPRLRWPREHVSGHPAAPPAPHRRAPLARPRDGLDLGRLRLSALRRARDRANEELPALGALLGRRPRRARPRSCSGSGCPAVILFGIPEEKDDEGSGAYAADGIVQRALRALRERYPELVLVTDVCLCEYTSHGHCGVIEDGEVAQRRHARAARAHRGQPRRGRRRRRRAERHDGRARRRDPGGARRGGFEETPILSYAAKYASAFYGPFREAAESAPAFGDRRGYQMDPANVREALRECELDVAEGADVLMVKPALPYLDVIRAVRERFDLPVAAYNVSGEYAMVKAAAARGWLDERAGRARVADRDQARRRRLRRHVLGEGARRLALKSQSELWRGRPSG